MHALLTERHGTNKGFWCQVPTEVTNLIPHDDCGFRRNQSLVSFPAAMSLAVPANAAMSSTAGGRLVVLAQAMIPRTGMMDAQNPMPMKERYLKRFPQPAQVGHLIGMPVLDLNSKTLGYVRRVVRNPAGEIHFIVDYSRWWGWFGQPVAVPLEALGIEAGHLVWLDMSPSEYAAAPTWRDTEGTPLPDDATVLVALSRS
jgi:hypothetical protein